MSINYAIIAFTQDAEFTEILHFCGFEERPTEEQFLLIKNLLENDPAYKLVGKDFDMREAEPALVKYYMHSPDEDSYRFRDNILMPL